MNSTTKRVLIFTIVAIFMLGACAPAAPTQDPAEVQQQIDDAVALTVAAQNAEAEQAAAALPTNTPLPTQTPEVPPTEMPVIPTATPFVVVPPTATLVPSSGGSSSGGSAPVPLDYDCTSQDRRPYDNAYFKPGNEFDINWTIVNTGTKSWPAGMDVKYYSGPHISKTTVVELPAMAPGDKYVIVLDGVAPSKVGFYVETWVVEGQLCFPYVAINVE